MNEKELKKQLEDAVKSGKYVKVTPQDLMHGESREAVAHQVSERFEVCRNCAQAGVNHIAEITGLRRD